MYSPHNELYREELTAEKVEELYTMREFLTTMLALILHNDKDQLAFQDISHFLLGSKAVLQNMAIIRKTSAIRRKPRYVS